MAGVVATRDFPMSSTGGLFSMSSILAGQQCVAPAGDPSNMSGGLTYGKPGTYSGVHSGLRPSCCQATASFCRQLSPVTHHADAPGYHDALAELTGAGKNATGLDARAYFDGDYCDQLASRQVVSLSDATTRAVNCNALSFSGQHATVVTDQHPRLSPSCDDCGSWKENRETSKWEKARSPTRGCHHDDPGG